MKQLLFSLISIPVYAVLYLYTALMVVLSIFFKLCRLNKLVLYTIFLWGNGIFLLMGVRLKITGKANIVKNKNYLLLANHSSLFDIPAIMAVLPGVSWFGRDYLTRIPIFGYLLRLINYIPMKSTDMRNTKNMLNTLISNSRGLTIAMFPEGTRTMTGDLQNLKRGFIHVLRAADIDILPVTLKGMFELKPKTRFSIRLFSVVEVEIKPVVLKSSLNAMSDQEILNTIGNCLNPN